MQTHCPTLSFSPSQPSPGPHHYQHSGPTLFKPAFSFQLFTVHGGQRRKKKCINPQLLARVLYVFHAAQATPHPATGNPGSKMHKHTMPPCMGGDKSQMCTHSENSTTVFAMSMSWQPFFFIISSFAYLQVYTSIQGLASRMMLWSCLRWHPGAAVRKQGPLL